MLLNQQKRYPLRLSPLHPYVQSLKRRLQLGRGDFNICFVDDGAIRRMNAAYRGQDRATDVLSFPWGEHARSSLAAARAGRGHHAARRPAKTSGPVRAEFEGFLGDVVISVETARRNARGEGHSTLNEIRWLILHGVLHLLGYDHESDSGEMTALELALREQLGVAVGRGRNGSK
jgi:probable rRNA maturation factor